MSRFVQLPVSAYSPTAFEAFSPQRGHFDLDDARAMMWMAQLAYESDAPHTILQVGPLWGFKSIRLVRAQGPAIDTRAIIGERADCTVVAFAGTDPAVAKNLITNVKFRLSIADTHEGFQDAIDAAWPQIEMQIRTSQEPLFFAGHSLGAALAVLAAEKAQRSGITPAAVYAFGMPRVGGSGFAGRYNKMLGDRTFRLVHGGDIVACIPQAIVRIAPPARVPFQHVGRMLKCDSGAKFDRFAQPTPTNCNEPTIQAGVRENTRNRVTAALAGKLLALTGPGRLGPLYALLPFAIRDHLPDRYRSALEP
jgi:triacylglycerol lipase